MRGHLLDQRSLKPIFRLGTFSSARHAPFEERRLTRECSLHVTAAVSGARCGGGGGPFGHCAYLKSSFFLTIDNLLLPFPAEMFYDRLFFSKVVLLGERFAEGV